MFLVKRTPLRGFMPPRGKAFSSVAAGRALPGLFQFEGVIGDGPCFVEINQPAGGIGRDYIGFFPSGKRFVGTFVTISFVA